MPGKRICFITPGHISSNPRLVKEAKAAEKAGYEIVIVFAQYLSRLVPFDQEILIRHPKWKAMPVSFAGSSFREAFFRLFYSLQQRLFKIISPEWAFNRHYRKELKNAKKANADLFIAHNLGALPVAANAAQALKVPFGFDAEDYHRAEEEEFNSQKAKIEERYIPGAAYTAAASPLIAREYSANFPNKTWTSILNVFSLSQQTAFVPLEKDTLSIYWFSQFVGRGRGLEEFFESIALLPEIPLNITLVGLCTPENQHFFKSGIKSTSHKVELIDTVAEDKLIQLAANHHLGLALERKTPPNRNICLTNKIFTYLLAGNAVIASDTDAQKQFMEQYPGIGRVYPIGDAQALAQIIRHYHENRAELEAARRRAWELARTELNWEKEQTKFLQLIEHTLASR
jgi:glycosyltransferase involved in cell wall biosynthesis